jgi:hypothetical protein
VQAEPQRQPAPLGKPIAGGHDHAADLGGSWEYIQRYARKQRIDVLRACTLVLGRACEAVALVLDAAEALREPSSYPPPPQIDDRARHVSC